ncbi:uracil-DNA glycosylase [Marinilabiliaceae bacterium JC017]|nr:uracil-DNA glycosylase [Marinilabiliaceae bacterium JC017]
MLHLIDKMHSQVHPSWNDFLTEEVTGLLKQIEEKLENGEGVFTPPVSRVFHFMSMDLMAVKVLLIGQDPYPQEGVATGRAFEVATLKSWDDPFRNVSLKNIIRALYNAYCDDFKKYNEIKTIMKNGLFGQSFSVLPPDQLFKHWEQEGVLMLNTSFTCRIGYAGSHAKIWAPFTRLLLSYIAEKNPSITWFLWGNHAKGITSHLTLQKSMTSNHPMICKEGEEDFLFGKVNMFKATSHLIDWTGKNRR